MRALWRRTDQPAVALAAALADKRAHDMRRGLTHAGPHRDDLVITLDGRELRTFGSAGQQRTAAIALRMLEAATFHERTGRAPLFLLDDPFAELDARRAARVLDLLTRDGLGPDDARGAARERHSRRSSPGSTARLRVDRRRRVHPNRAHERSMSDRKKKPEAIGNIVATWLGESGLTERDIRRESFRSGPSSSDRRSPR